MLNQHEVIAELRRKLNDPNYDAEEQRKKQELDSLDREIEEMKIEKLRQERKRELEEYEERKELEYKEEMLQFNEIQRKLLNLAEKMAKQPQVPNIIQLPQPAPPMPVYPPPYYPPQYPPPQYHQPTPLDSSNRNATTTRTQTSSPTQRPSPHDSVRVTSDRQPLNIDLPSNRTQGYGSGSFGPLVPPTDFETQRTTTGRNQSSRRQQNDHNDDIDGSDDPEEEQPKYTSKSKGTVKSQGGKSKNDSNRTQGSKLESGKQSSKKSGKIEEIKEEGEEEDPDEVETKKTLKKDTNRTKKSTKDDKPLSSLKTNKPEKASKKDSKTPRMDFSEVRPEPFDPQEEDILVYINRGVLMPSNINASKIFVYCYNEDGQDVLFEKSSIGSLDSDIYHPNYKIPFRISTLKLKENMNLHFYMLFTTLEEVATMTSRTKKTVSAILGVAYFPFFIQGADHSPASLDLQVVTVDQDYILNSGNYSIPIYFPQYTEHSPQAIRSMMSQ